MRGLRLRKGTSLARRLLACKQGSRPGSQTAQSQCSLPTPPSGPGPRSQGSWGRRAREWLPKVILSIALRPPQPMTVHPVLRAAPGRRFRKSTSSTRPGVAVPTVGKFHHLSHRSPSCCGVGPFPFVLSHRTVRETRWGALLRPEERSSTKGKGRSGTGSESPAQVQTQVRAARVAKLVSWCPGRPQPRWGSLTHRLRAPRPTPCPPGLTHLAWELRNRAGLRARAPGSWGAGFKAPQAPQETSAARPLCAEATVGKSITDGESPAWQEAGRPPGEAAWGRGWRSQKPDQRLCLENTPEERRVWARARRLE